MLTWIKKHKILFVIEVLCLVLLLPGCFAGEKAVVESREVAGTGSHRIGDIALKPGVYRLEVRDAVLEDGVVGVNIVSETATYMALRYNEAHVTKQVTEVNRLIYVTDAVKDAFIECVPDGIGNNQLSVALVRLNLGSRIALFYGALGCLVLNLLMGLRERILAGSVSKEKLLAGGVLTLAVGLVYLPYATDYFSFAGDIQIHLAEIERLSENSMQGILGNLYLLPAVLFRMVGLPLMTAYKLYLLILLALTATMTYYGLKWCTGSVMAAALGSFVYTVSPYLVSAVYVSQALDRILVLAFLPFAVCAVVCGIFGRKKQGAPAAFPVSWARGEKGGRINPNVVRAIIILVFLVALGTVVYQTNDIALHNPVVRLYDM